MKINKNTYAKEVKQKQLEFIDKADNIYNGQIEKNTTIGEYARNHINGNLTNSRKKFNENDFITLFLTKLYENGIIKIDTLQLKHDLSEFYLNEKYSSLFDDISLKEQIEGSFLELDDALLFAQLLGLLSNTIQETTERVILGNNFELCINYPEEYINKMNELVNEYKLKLCTNKFKKNKLNYTSTVSKIKPVDTIPVNGSKLEELDLNTKEKCSQNHLNNYNFENDNILLYPVKSDSYANIANVLDEWIRFLSYIKPEELLYLNELNSKTFNQLTTKEKEKYLKIKKQIAMSELFIKYKNRDCTKEEYDQVIKFMDNSLKSFMKEKLTEEEIKKSYILLGEFRKMSNSELNEFIDKQTNNYDNLTIFEAYILYEVKEIKYYRYNEEVNNIIRNNQIEGRNDLIKRLIKDFGLRI